MLSIALILLAGAGGSSSARSANDSPPQLPLIGCKTWDVPTTTDGAVWKLPRNLPKKAEAPSGVTAHQASRLAWYEGLLNVRREFRLLAPRGWACSATRYEDGLWTM